MKKEVRRVEDLEVFQLLYKLAVDVTKNAERFSSRFRWLDTQLSRSAESAPANLAEGFYSQYSTEYLQSLHRVRREAREAQVHLRFAGDVDQLALEEVQQFVQRYERALVKLNNIIAAVYRKMRSSGKAKVDTPQVREAEVSYDTIPVAIGTLFGEGTDSETEE